MKKLLFLILLLILFAFSSCEEKGIPFGTVEYYPSFLWVESNTKPVVKVFDLDFSEDAKNDPQSYAEFQFVDNDGKEMSSDIFQVFVDNVQMANARFRIPSDCKSKEITIVFTPKAKQGKYQGYLRLVSHKLDRIDSQQLTLGQKVDVLQWTLHYEKFMNPLAKVLLWIAIILISCLLLWFIVLRPALYPHFGNFTKSVLIEKNGAIVGQQTYPFKGARKVVFYNQKVKQSLLEKIFIGEVKTFVNPAFTSPLTFSPSKRNATVYGIGYMVKPNPIPRSGIATITHTQNKIKITLR